jgi:hypothetical protein
MEKLFFFLDLQWIDWFNMVAQLSRRLHFQPQTFTERMLFFFEIALRS